MLVATWYCAVASARFVLAVCLSGSSHRAALASGKQPRPSEAQLQAPNIYASSYRSLTVASLYI
eukprot:scaffold46999_cov20-Prasinocladus_malaysianus.AAC.1